jgi:hypothetical protein
MSAADIIASPLRGDEAGVLRVVGNTSVGGVRADLVEVPPGSGTAFGSHLVVVWTVNAHTYALGFHGTDDVARQLDESVISDLELIQP